MGQRHHQPQTLQEPQQPPVTKNYGTSFQKFEKNENEENTEDVNPNPQQPKGINIDDQKATNAPETTSKTTDKQNQNLCCYNRFNRMQCLFIIIGILSITAGAIAIGVMLGRSWVKNSVKARATPIYTIKFVTPTGNYIATQKVVIEQKYLLKQNTQNTFLVTTSQRPTTDGRNLQQTDNSAVSAYNPPAFVTYTEGAITAKAANSEDVALLINVQELPKELKATDSTRLLEESDWKQKLVDEIKNKMAQQAEVDPSQVSVTEQIYVKLIPSQKGKLVVEKTQDFRLLTDEIVNKEPANSASTQKAQPAKKDKPVQKENTNEKANTDKKASSNKAKKTKEDTTKNIVKQRLDEQPNFLIKAAAHIAHFFRGVRQKFRKYSKTLEKQSKSQFKQTNDIKVSQEEQKMVGNNHLLITRVYTDGLHRKPKQIKNTHVIPKEQFEGLKHCFQGQDGKYCKHQFINREDNPFEVSDESLDNPQQHKKYKLIKVAIHDKDDKKHSNKQHEPHNHAQRRGINNKTRQHTANHNNYKNKIKDPDGAKPQQVPANNIKKQEPKPVKVEQSKVKKQEPKPVKTDQTKVQPKKQEVKLAEPKKTDTPVDTPKQTTSTASSNQNEPAPKSTSNIVSNQNQAVAANGGK